MGRTVTPRPATSPAAVRYLMALSRHLLRAEHAAVKGLMALLCMLVLLNVVTRYAGMPIYWVDESAVFSVVWLTFIGGSAMTRMRLDFAMTLVTERLSRRAAAVARAVSTACVLAFGLMLGWMCCLWMDPVGIAASGFDAKEFAAQSFNFLYTERTQTLNWPTWILYLIMPIFAAALVVHGTANLLEDLGLAERSTLPDFASTPAEGIVN